MKDLKPSVRRSNANVHRKIAWYAAVLSNHLNAVKAASLEALPVSKISVRDETPKRNSDNVDRNCGAGFSSVERPSRS